MQVKAFFDLTQPKIRYKWMVFSRILAAVFLGYLLSALISIATSLLCVKFGIADSQAVLSATLPSFLIYSMIVVFIFSCKSLQKMWSWLIGLNVMAFFIIILLEHLGS